MKKFISIILVLAMVFSLSSTAFAAENRSYIQKDGTTEEIQLAKESYEALSPEAKAIFEASLALNPELLEFHKEYVDPSFKSTKAIEKSALAGVGQLKSTMAVAAVADPMTILNAQLAALSLPTSVLYSLQAMGAGMVAAIADGPLPIGDIILAAATVSAAVIIAANWNTICSKWNSIVAAFKTAFAASAANVTSAFNSILNQVNDELAVNPSVTISGRTVTVNGVRYTCNTKADSLTQSQTQNKRYFPAVLYNGTVYVDPAHSLTTAAAKVFIYINSSSIGIWATSESYARGLCGGTSAIWHNVHSSSEGYFYHYHHPNYGKFHCWYL